MRGCRRAAATTRIRLGVLVTANVHRHPAVLANMIATVDVVSAGRLEIGLGAGWNAQECDAYGLPLFSVRERLERLDEAALRTCERMQAAGAHRAILGLPLPDRTGLLHELVETLT